MGLMSGKVVAITGAGGGIGRAIAMLFASEDARIVVNDLGCARDGTGSSPEAADATCAAIVAQGGEAVASHASVATPEGAASVVELAVKTWGRLDTLVNCAGIVRDRSLLKMDAQAFDPVVAALLHGALYGTQAAARQMITQGGGRIVNFTAVAGLMGNLGQANFAAANAGIYGLTRTASIELQKHRITVNAIAPLARTRMTEDLPMMQGIDSLTPEHVAPVALFLGSELCADRSGMVLAVAGARLYAYKLIESDGRFKDDGTPWTASEIAANLDSITRVGKG